MELSQAAGALLRMRMRPSKLVSAMTPFATLMTHRSLSTTLVRRQDQSDKPDQDNMDKLLDASLDFTKGVPTASQHRPSRYPSRQAQSEHRGYSAPSPQSEKATSMHDIWNAMPMPRTRVQDSFPIRMPVEPVRPLPFTPNPTLGRTIETQNGDVARAFRTLDIQISRNKVRSDVVKQRFHERGGLKRKRLASERWRRRFKEAFRGTVKMVNKMKKQGW